MTERISSEVRPRCGERRLSPLVAVVGIVGLALHSAACSDGGPSNAATAAAYRDAGPYVAAVTTLDLGDSRVEVWYPADPGAEAGRAHDVYYIRDWLPQAIDDFLPPDI